MLSDKEKEDIKVIFDQKVHNLTCPMCKNQNFTMADGYFVNNMLSDIQTVSLGGQGIPTIGIVCTNCGFVSQHALGALGILEGLKKKKEDDSTK